MTRVNLQLPPADVRGEHLACLRFYLYVPTTLNHLEHSSPLQITDTFDQKTRQQQHLEATTAYSFDDDPHLHGDHFHGDHGHHDDVGAHGGLHVGALGPASPHDGIRHDFDSQRCPYFPESISLCFAHVSHKMIHRERTYHISLFGCATEGSAESGDWKIRPAPPSSKLSSLPAP